MYDSTHDTLEHIAEVQRRMLTVVLDLEARAQAHDRSKLDDPEKSGFDEATPLLKSLTYGSPEYEAARTGILKPALDHHYFVNDHHPEYYAYTLGSDWPGVQHMIASGEAIGCMPLPALMEMLCDWHAAVMRHNDGDFVKSLKINRQRFGMSDQLFNILVETSKYFGFIPRETIFERDSTT